MMPRVHNSNRPGLDSRREAQTNNTNSGAPAGKRTFVAHNGSPAAESGNSNMSRLSSEAMSKLRKDGGSDLSSDTLAFLARIYFDKKLNRLQIRESEGGSARDLTKEEKRRFIKTMVNILLMMYVKKVKHLSSTKKAEAEVKLMAKY